MWKDTGVRWECGDTALLVSIPRTELSEEELSTAEFPLSADTVAEAGHSGLLLRDKAAAAAAAADPGTAPDGEPKLLGATGMPPTPTPTCSWPP